MNRSNSITSSVAPITDSPWLWVLIYTSVPLVTLTLLSHKYGERQSKIEWRDQVAERAGEQKSIDTAAEPKSQETSDSPSDSSPRQAPPTYSSPDDTRIPVMPLTALLWVIECVAAVMLTRERRKLAQLRADAGPSPNGIAPS